MWIVWLRFLIVASTLAVSDAAQWTLSRDQPVRVGDQVTLRLEGFTGQPLDIETVQFDLAGKSLQQFGWVQVGQPTVTADGVALSLIATQAGEIELPRASLLGRNRTALTMVKSQKFKVESVVNPEESAPDWIGPEGLPFPWVYWVVMVIVMALIIALVVWGAFRLWKKRKPKKTVPVAPPLPDDVWATQALDALNDSEIVRQGQWKQVAYSVTDIVKEFLSRRYRFDAPEMTSEECIAHLRTLGVWPDIGQLMHSLDGVKFADQPGSNALWKQWLERAKQGVRP